MVLVKITLLYILRFVQYLLFARAILSWFVRDYNNSVMRFLATVTEPLIEPVREIMNKLGLGGGMIDFSFMATFFIIITLERMLLSTF